MPPTLSPSLPALIPQADLARAVRLAFDTLLSIMQDKASAVRDKRMAATAVLRLAMPQTSPGRKPGVNPPRAQPPAPTPHPTPANAATTAAHAPPLPNAPLAHTPAPPAPAPHTSAIPDTAPSHTPRRASTLLAAVGTALYSPLHPRAA
jgi:hypothetical protein